MRLTLAAIGRLRAGPEQALVEDYLGRAARTGRAVGLGPCSVHEVEAQAGGAAAEAALLLRAVRPGAALCALDERGEALSSPAFAARLAAWRDAGRPEAAFLLGGADGLAPAVRERADLVLSFGPMVWPHLLARAMLAEQIYRAVTILAGTPYHRG